MCNPLLEQRSTPRPPSWSVVVVALSLVLFGPSRPGRAIILLLKNDSRPVRGYLVRQEEQAVVLREVLSDGDTKLRTVPRSTIDDVIISVSLERLGKLDPSKPDAYREYAEELAEKRRDPDARQAGIRLFLIAAHLAPERLGRSCLLGMIPLARNELEQRRFQAMAYLLDPAHDSNLLRAPLPSKPTITTTTDPKRAKAMLRAVRLLRQGRKSEALLQVNRFHLKQYWADLTSTISFDEFYAACQPRCPDCREGLIVCPTCHGRKFIIEAGHRRPCPVCHGKGKVACPTCGGTNRTTSIPAPLLRRLIQLEAAWIAPPTPAQPTDIAPNAPPNIGWAAAIGQDRTAPVRPLQLDTLTEFNPRNCRYRDNKWTQ